MVCLPWIWVFLLFLIFVATQVGEEFSSIGKQLN